MAEKTKIAKVALFIDGVRAHNPGDEVPEENVERNGWQDLVVGPDTKTAKAITES